MLASLGTCANVVSLAPACGTLQWYSSTHTCTPTRVRFVMPCSMPLARWRCNLLRPQHSTWVERFIEGNKPDQWAREWLASEPCTALDGLYCRRGQMDVRRCRPLNLLSPSSTAGPSTRPPWTCCNGRRRSRSQQLYCNNPGGAEPEEQLSIARAKHHPESRRCTSEVRGTRPTSIVNNKFFHCCTLPLPLSCPAPAFNQSSSNPSGVLY